MTKEPRCMRAGHLHAKLQGRNGRFASTGAFLRYIVPDILTDSPNQFEFFHSFFHSSLDIQPTGDGTNNCPQCLPVRKRCSRPEVGSAGCPHAFSSVYDAGLQRIIVYYVHKPIQLLPFQPTYPRFTLGRLEYNAIVHIIVPAKIHDRRIIYAFIKTINIRSRLYMFSPAQHVAVSINLPKLTISASC